MARVDCHSSGAVIARSTLDRMEAIGEPLRLSRAAIVARAVEHWLLKPEEQRRAIPPSVSRRKGIMQHAYLAPAIAVLLFREADSKSVGIGRLIEAAILQWLDEVGEPLAALLPDASKLKTRRGQHPKPKLVPAPPPPPVIDGDPDDYTDEDGDDPAEILRQQIAYYERVGNRLRVAQLRRELHAPAG